MQLVASRAFRTLAWCWLSGYIGAWLLPHYARQSASLLRQVDALYQIL